MKPLNRHHRLDNMKAVVFDFDGTLAVLNIDFSLMRAKVFELLIQFRVDQDRIREKYLLEIIEEIYGLLLTRSRSSATDFYQQAHRILQEIELESAAQGQMIPGSKEVLKGLRERGLKVGIVTRNCGAAVRRVFPDVEGHCDAFLSRDGIKNVKPHPEHLVSVMRALQVSGEESVMVGDHTIDILAGRRAEMVTIGVLTGRITREEFEQAGADWVLNSVSEIGDLFGDRSVT